MQPSEAERVSGRPGRLTRRADYERVQSGGRKIRSSTLLLLVGRGEGALTRVGLTVSRKVGIAVIRNRVKRWLREAVRAVGAPPGGPWDVVIIARAESASAGYEALRGEVATMFSRVRP